MKLSSKSRLFFIVLSSLLFIANAKAQITFTFSSPTVDSANKAYTLTGVGAFYKSTSISSISTTNITCNGNTPAAVTGSNTFVFLTDLSGIVGIEIYGQGTGSKRTFASLSTSTSIGGTYTTDATAASSDTMKTSGVCDSMLITTGTPIAAGTFMQIVLSGNIDITSIVLLSSANFTAPVLSTTSPAAITSTSATVGGNITSNGNASLIARGIVYSTSPNPQIGGFGVTNIVDAGTGIGIYSDSLPGLVPSTLYYVEAYATNALGTSYGGDSTFTTPAPSPVIITSPSNISFGPVTVDSTSVQPLTLSGNYLTSNGTITITPPAGYLVSLSNNSGFASSLQVPYSGQTLGSTTIYIQFLPTSTSASYADSINISGGGTSLNVAVSGAGIPPGLKFQSSFSNQGTDFWTGFGPHEKSASADGTNNNAEMTLYFTSADTATVNIYVGNDLVQTLSLPAGSITASALIPWSGVDDARLLVDSLYVGKGVHITSTSPIVAYAEIWGSQVTSASVLFPTNTLGRSYTALNYTQVSNDEGDVQDRSYVFAVATQDSTEVQVTLPPGITSGSGLTGTNTKILNKGDVWLVTAADGETDITGTEVKSISTNGTACNPIAVFSGTGKINITCGADAGASGDNLFQQAFPYVAWGKNFVSAPTGGANYSYNIYRVMLNPDSAANTTVTVNGVVLSPTAGTVVTGLSSSNPVTAGAPISLTNNLYYEFATNQPVTISASSPVMVAQYITNSSNYCDNDYDGGKIGDPDMVYLSPVEQTINNIIVSPVNTQNGNSVNYINVVIKTTDVSNFSITTQNGTTQTPAFTPIGDGTYSYWQDSIALGYSPNVFYTLSSTGAGFNAIAYGYSKAESYAYNAGTSLNNLSSAITVQNQYGTGTASSVCRGGQFNMKVLLPYASTSEIIFNYSNNPNLIPNTPDTVLNPVYDTSYIINGATLYEYVNPNPHTYTLLGNLPVTVEAQNPTSDGCSLTEFPFSIAVTQGPIANFTFPSQNGCSGTVLFTDSSLGNGQVINKWVWNYGDGSGTNTLTPPDSTIENPSHTYTSGGTYTVKLRVITQQGCYADTSKLLPFSSAVVAGFTVNHDSICVGSAITFTDTSSVQNGTITQRTWSFDDGTPDTVVTTSAPVSHTYTTAGIYTDTLTVLSSGGCSVIATKQVTVSAIPVVTFGPVAAVCANTSSIDLTTFVSPSGGTFRGAGISGNSFNPAVAGSGQQVITYSYTSAGGCSDSLTQTITVNPSTPLTITPVGPICINADAVTLAGTPSGGTFTIDGTVGSSFTPAAAGVGAHQIIYSVEGGCANPDTIQVIVGDTPTVHASANPISITAGSTITLTGTSTIAGTYQWSDTTATAILSSTDSVTTSQPTQTTLYTFAVTTSTNCTASDTVSVIVTLPCPLYPPRLITPNGDGKNETWILAKGDCITSAAVNIYNRWGGKVYYSGNYNNDWAGTYNGNPLPDGTYYYVIQVTENGVLYTLTGNITILR